MSRASAERDHECFLSRHHNLPPCKSIFACGLRQTAKNSQLMNNIRALSTQDSEAGRSARLALEAIETEARRRANDRLSNLRAELGQRDASGG
jgi:hypothetical protein